MSAGSSIGPPPPTIDPTKYETIAELGRGGMAMVYLAAVRGPGAFTKLQVLKRLRPALAADVQFRDMFLDEARIAAHISHPNVVQTYEVGFDGEHYFIAMEFLDGQSLDAVVRRASDRGITLPLSFRLYVLVETLAGLHAAHELKGYDGSPLNVVHRDVSPHNVMITYDGRVKVLDFGIAKAAGGSEETRSGILKGKAAYMAPEQFRNGEVDRRADVFAVGVMLWQMLTGQRLWPADRSDVEIYRSLMANQIPRPSAHAADVTPALEAICMRALAIDPAARFATAADMLAAIEAQLATLEPRASMRMVGETLRSLFEDERKAMRAVLESHGKAPPKSQTSVPALVPADAAANVPALWRPNDGPEHSPTSQSFVAASSTETPPPPPRRVSQRTMVVAALGALVLAVGLGFGLRSAMRHGADAAATAGSSSAPSATSSTTTPSSLIDLTVTAAPKQARVFVDNTALEGNPAKISLVRDGASHMLRVEADGYRTHKELVTFDKDSLAINVYLDAASPSSPKTPTWTPPRRGGGGQPHAQDETAPVAPAPDPSPSPAATPAPSPTTPAAPSDNARQRRPDTRDPWSH